MKQSTRSQGSQSVTTPVVETEGRGGDQSVGRWMPEYKCSGGCGPRFDAFPPTRCFLCLQLEARARAHTLVAGSRVEEEEEEEWLELDGVRGLVVLVVAVGDDQCGQPS
jgi:hypothetical protein